MVFISCISISLRPENYLETTQAHLEEITGTFTLILYGANHINDLETLAIMDREGDNIKFQPHAPEFLYRVKRGIAAGEALKESIKFISWHNSFHHYEINKIMDKENNILGYEVRPIYEPLAFGISDVLDVNYIIEEGYVRIFIRLMPSVERMLYNDEKKNE